MASPNKTRIQVATDPAFSNIIYDVNGAYTTELLIAESELPTGTNLYARGMHGHPDTGDSSWSTTVQFMVAVAYGNSLYYTAGDYTFTVPAGVNEICIAATPGADYSSAGELLKAYTGKTVACVAGNNTVPVGISSVTLSGKGAAGTSGYGAYVVSSYTYAANASPSSFSSPPSTIQAYISGTLYTFYKRNTTTTQVTYQYQMSEPGDAYVTYTRSPVTTTGAATTAVVNGTTYTFPGGIGGAAPITNHTVAVNPATGATISANIAAGGSLSYSYSAYAINALSSLLGNNFSLSPVAKDVGTYVGGIAAWRNSIPVSPGDTIPVHVSAGGAVNIIWGTGRAFPNSEV